MKNGYVTFVDDNPKYLQLTEILIESIINFSNYDVEIFSINSEYIHSSSRVISRRIDLTKKSFGTICYSKLKCSYESDFDFSVQLDSDFIITKNMDKLFDNSDRIKELPLGSLHPRDPNDQKQIMGMLGVESKTQPYVHATYFFSKNCKQFFYECFEFSEYCEKNNITPPNYDETIYNTMLWKYNSNDWLDCYDPYFGLFLDRNTKQTHGYDWMDNINYYSCHGIKDPEHAKLVLEKLIKQEI
jgi:hypothetical protein